MSCAGLMGLAISASRPSLAERQTARARGAALAADPAFQAALRAVGQDARRAGNHSDIYYLWSLERVCVALGLRSLDGFDWYARRRARSCSTGRRATAAGRATTGADCRVPHSPCCSCGRPTSRLRSIGCCDCLDRTLSQPRRPRQRELPSRRTRQTWLRPRRLAARRRKNRAVRPVLIR